MTVIDTRVETMTKIGEYDLIEHPEWQSTAIVWHDPIDDYFYLSCDEGPIERPVDLGTEKFGPYTLEGIACVVPSMVADPILHEYVVEDLNNDLATFWANI